MALIALPIRLVIALIYNSPFAIFFPPLESGDTVQSVTSAYVAEFNREVTELVNTHDSWSDTYRNPEVFEWLLSNKNSNITELIDNYQGSEMYG